MKLKLLTLSLERIRMSNLTLSQCLEIIKRRMSGRAQTQSQLPWKADTIRKMNLARMTAKETPWVPM